MACHEPDDENPDRHRLWAGSPGESPNPCPTSREPSLQECCDSPWNSGYGNVSLDGYTCAEECNHHLKTYEETVSLDRDPSDLCTDLDGGSPKNPVFPDVATVGDGVQACSSVGFSRVEDCYNTTLPEPPSIRRSLITPNHDDGDTEVVKSWSDQSPVSPGQWLALNNHRASANARLVQSGSSTRLKALFPENLDYGMRALADEQRPPLGGGTGFLDLWTRFSPKEGASLFSDISEDGALSLPGGIELCSTQGAEPTPRTCRARRNASEPWRDGDCYEQTVVTTLNGRDQGKRLWELRSLDVVVFVEGGKDAIRRGEAVWVFPRSAVSDFGALPDRDLFSYTSNVACYAEGECDWHSPSLLRSRYEESCAGEKEPWCAFVDDQRSLQPGEEFNMAGDGWGRRNGDHWLFEPTVTADGMVLVINGGNKIMYSYNDVGPCDATGWTEFKHLSSAVDDGDVNEAYGFAAHRIRGTNGDVIPPGSPVRGAYPWIDRAGDNLLFPTAIGQDGFNVTWNESLTWSGQDGQTYSRNAGELVQPSEMDDAHARGVVVVGSWTRGKQVLLDGGLNLTDWRKPIYPARNSKFRIQLYDGESTVFRHEASTKVASNENQFSEYEAWSPISPFDVVWMASNDNMHASEIVFDDYLDPDALVVAHMNSPIVFDGSGDFDLGTDDNGFVSGGEQENYEFARSPRLQNASTSLDAPQIRLLGGAWVPPVAEGGVKGKGVWLDGRNDYLEVVGDVSIEEGFYMGVWLDWRDGWFESRLFSWGDDASVSIRASRYVEGDFGTIVEPVNEVVLRSGGEDDVVVVGNLEPGRYQHVAIAAYPEGTDVYIDGTYAGSSGLVMAIPSSGMTLGLAASSDDGPRSIRGWVDELRLYRIAAEHRLGGYHMEKFCNQALGSLVEGENGLECDQIDIWAPRLVGPEGLDSSLDFPGDAYLTRHCGNSVHRNSPPGETCMRTEALELDGRHLVPTLVRPGFGDVPFCRSCHSDAADPVPGLRPDALEAGMVPMMDDPRRQPMMWRRGISGWLPALDGEPLCQGPELDPCILGDSADVAPTRIPPQ